MLQRRGGLRPHGWIGDDEMGRPAWFRKELAERKERYLLAVRSNTSLRDREAEPPAYRGQGRRPKAPFQGVRAWCDELPAGAWTRLTVRDGEKGPLEVEIIVRRVESKIERRVVSFEEVLVVVRFEEGGALKHDYYLYYYLSNAAQGTAPEELMRVAKACHRIEEGLKRGESEAGLGDYQVRNWVGWHHHQALSLIATWFLVGEARRGKKATPALTVPRVRAGLATIFRKACWSDTEARSARADTLAGAQRVGAAVPLQVTQSVATIED
jgi:SRSO17 transposase